MFHAATAMLLSTVLLAPGPLLAPREEVFFHDQAKRVVDSAALAAGQSWGKWRNNTPYAVHVPGGNMGYTAFWVRDAVMMLGGDFISAGEVEGWIRLMSSTVRTKDWQVRPGVVVPAYAIPDHINFDGKPTFYPGNYETGEKQGGYPWGKYPPLDDQFYFIGAVYSHWKMTGSLRLFSSKVKIASGEMKVAELCDHVFRVVPADAETGLAFAGDVETENAKDFGFCDGEFKSGRLLFTSTLKYLAANQLAELHRAAAGAAQTERFEREVARIRRALPALFFHPAPGGREGWLHSSTGVGNQPDVWGSAFAIWSGAVGGAVADQVARALARAYREKTAVRQGCVRQVLTTDPRGGWERSLTKPGEYQNGGYWGTATGWYIAAVHRVDPQAAADMAHDYIEFLATDPRPDGIARSWEWFNPDTGKRKNPLYVATVVLPYVSLRQAGLIGTK